MAGLRPPKVGAQIVYFDTDGRQNLDEVLRVVRRVLRKREDLKRCKIVFFTAHGEGPALARVKFAEFQPKIIAVTFPRTYAVRREGHPYFPRISDPVLKFFAEVGIDVLVPPTLPFDPIEGMEGHNQQVRLVRDTISIFGAGFSLSLQAVIRACDVGLVEEGESIIGISGDTAALFTASTTASFLSKSKGVLVQEIFCKPRKFTLVRTSSRQKLLDAGKASAQADVAPKSES